MSNKETAECLLAVDKFVTCPIKRHHKQKGLEDNAFICSGGGIRLEVGVTKTILCVKQWLRPQVHVKKSPQMSFLSQLLS